MPVRRLPSKIFVQTNECIKTFDEYYTLLMSITLHVNLSIFQRKCNRKTKFMIWETFIYVNYRNCQLQFNFQSRPRFFRRYFLIDRMCAPVLKCFAKSDRTIKRKSCINSRFFSSRLEISISLNRFVVSLYDLTIEKLNFKLKMKIILVLCAVVGVSISKNITKDSQTIKNCLEVIFIYHYCQHWSISFGCEIFFQNFFQCFNFPFLSALLRFEAIPSYLLSLFFYSHRIFYKQLVKRLRECSLS